MDSVSEPSLDCHHHVYSSLSTDYTLAWLFYFADILNLGGLAYLFFEMLKYKSVADETIQSLDSNSKPMASIIR